MNRTLRSPVAAALTAVALSYCATLPELGEDDHGAPGHVVTREQIVRSSARTLWDVFRCCTDLRLVEGRDGRGVAMDHRGSNSLYLSDTPLMYVDGIRVSDISSLGTMPADDVEFVRIYSAAEAGGRFGIGSDNGVVEIVTRR